MNVILRFFLTFFVPLISLLSFSYLYKYINIYILIYIKSHIFIGVALITGYPFTFSALRDGIMDILKIKNEERNKVFIPITLTSLSVLTALALVLKDVGFVVSISGAMFGCSVMFIIPAIMNISLIRKQAKNMGKTLTKSNNFEIAANYGMMGTGFVMAVIGVLVSVLKQLGKL